MEERLRWTRIASGAVVRRDSTGPGPPLPAPRSPLRCGRGYQERRQGRRAHPTPEAAMPFDATPATDSTVLYRTRRERACALWESLPRERFDLRCYGSGSTACALGWLARARMGGWGWRAGGVPPRPGWGGGAPPGGGS